MMENNQSVKMTCSLFFQPFICFDRSIMMCSTLNTNQTASFPIPQNIEIEKNKYEKSLFERVVGGFKTRCLSILVCNQDNLPYIK